MEKKLNFTMPAIATYTQDAHILGILGEKKEAYSWIMSNYIQLYINSNIDEWQWGDFYFPMPYEQRACETCKWLAVQKLSESYVHKHWDSMVKFVRGLIEEDFYVDMMLNYRYISGGYHNSQKTDFVHDALIYGFNDEKKVFYCADFAITESRKYTLYECSYEDFEKAAGKSVCEIESYLNHMIYMLQVKEECDYEYDINNVICMLDAYLNQSTPEYWTSFNHANKKIIAFGLGYYKVIADFLRMGPEEIRKELVYLLKDRAKLMIDRLSYLKESFADPDGYIEGYQKLSDLLSKAVNLVVKYAISQKKEVACRAASVLEESMEFEREILTKIVSELKLNNHQ